MHNATSLMPVMPPPGTPVRLPVQPGTSVTIPAFTDHRAHITIPTTHVYTVPHKRIIDETTLRIWLRSEAFVRLLEFIQVLNNAAYQKKNSDACAESETVRKLVDMLDTLDKWIDEIPALETPQRFGNKAFRTWIDRLESNAASIISSILPPDRQPAVEELTPYLTGGFGHGTRLDYGSGHELSFTAWLCCLELLDVVTPEDHTAIVTRVFVKYLDVVRRLQRVYMLEPAGSHGVWGLDDHQFLPYFWGSAQLIDHPRLKPKSVMQADIVEHYSKEYMYLACIQYIHEVKKGPFHEHSPMLYDISGVPHWQKVNKGMLKMYIAEVLHKLPVVQHLPFGSLLPFDVPAENGNSSQS
ncbi:uncharacterized protein EV422DRAFT_392601 [Fimicolochytrium jonesii]|uniref:uncharacterized protein n=1 Tax=Fimicolochytrium jonesii TaxID=1396493 RepID=UPI0022FDF8B8|nr:uncharacterized protein EV422DRAFT_392601 [Fimicolochytrium jonesii]KAI8823114.1 hypothetical protein EV422DRAFT_392601 [Fimicolochytrium jonesii]